jgi:hypothetical protein
VVLILHALLHVGSDLSNGRDTAEVRVLELLSMESDCAAGWDLGIVISDLRVPLKFTLFSFTDRLLINYTSCSYIHLRGLFRL